ncbi:Cytochrome c oxidase subunit 1 [Jannaschia donghaensis]|uniref:Cytochrome c oxidase subunit 1 n=1 Tax=Jannaschia donghaensis TaxID=420998 RepID=A0A0M6YIR7_9RHOB|nr:Cytochrome c oxidase subunit 1 [Jannaschia donghaensis]
MIVIYSLVSLFGLIFAPLLAHLRGWKPAALFFAAAVVYGAFGAASFAQVQFVPSQIKQTEPAYHDTYYVVSHGYFTLNLGIAMAVFGAITWVQTRCGAMRYPTLTKILFWVLHIALIGSTAFQGALAFILPDRRRYIDYPELMETYVLTSLWSGFLSQMALLGLLGLLLWSILERWLGR